MNLEQKVKCLLTSWVQSDAEIVRESALEALGDLGPIVPCEVVFQCRHDKSSFVKIQLLEIASIYGGQNAKKLALELLDDKDDLVRLSALDVLFDFPPSEDAFGKIGKLIQSKNPIVRSSCSSVLGKMAFKKQSVDDLRRALSKERSPRAKVGMLEALYRLGDASNLDSLLKLLISDQYRVRCAVAHALATLVSKNNKQILRKTLQAALSNEKTVAVKSSLNSALRNLEKS